MEKYLDLFEGRHRGSVINTFLDPIRKGITDHSEIVKEVKKELAYKKRWRPLSPHYYLVEETFYYPGFNEFLDYYIAYNQLPKEQQEIAKKVKVFKKRKMKQLKEFFHSGRPLSWSAISSFEYDPIQFYDKYVLNKKTPSNVAMEFGKKIGEKLVIDPTFLPDVKRYKVFEHKLNAVIDGIPLVGFFDSFDPETKSFYEYKTSSSTKKWTKKSAQKHGQLLFYKLLIWKNYGIPPEQVNCHLFYIPCNQTGDFGIELTKNGKIQCFEVKHTTDDLLKFGQYIRDTYRKMEEYINQ